MDTIQELKSKLPGLLAQAEAYVAASTAESRPPTAEEKKNYDDTMNLYEATEHQIKMLERAKAARERLDAPGERQTRPDGTPPPAAAEPAIITGGHRPGASKGTDGFMHMGDFAMSVCRARAGGFRDPRLVQNAAATTFGSEAVGADGGFAVPPDFREEIIKKVQGEDSLFARTDQYTTDSNEVILPVDEDEPWASTGGIQVQWLGEGNSFSQSKPKLKEFIIRTNKIGALIPMSNETLQDAKRIGNYLNDKVPDKLGYAINASIIGGSGVGQMGGLIGAAANSPANGNVPSVVTQAAEGSQTAATVNYLNVTKMWSRMFGRLRNKDACWVINQDVEPQLAQMVVPGGSPGPAYLPPGGLSGLPYSTLLGKPILYSEACSAVGTPGDIILANFSAYATAVKDGGARTDVSMHLYFDADQTAFRIIMRVGGQPWWSKGIARAKSALPLGWAVVLAAR